MARAVISGQIRSFVLFGGVAALAAYGCSGGTSTSSTGISSGPSSTSASSTSGAGGAGGESAASSTSGAGGAGGTPIFMAVVTEIASGPEFQFPYDATPDLKGNDVYFTAVGPDKMPGVFHVKADGLSKAEVVLTGAPFVSPTGIAMAPDGATLIVADTGWETNGPYPGAIVTMPKGGGAPKVIPGTEGYAPQGVDIVIEGGKSVVYFTGDYDAKAYRIPLEGGSPEPLIMGIVPYPFDTVPGIAVLTDPKTKAFAVNVSAQGQGSIEEINIPGGKTYIDGLSLGIHAGAALSLDGSELFVSARDAVTKTSSILRFVVDTKEMTSITDVIKDYDEPAGLHRAFKANVFAFVDNQAHQSGAIFVIR